VSVGPGLLTPANLATFDNVEELDGGIDIGGGFSTLDLPCLRIAQEIEVSNQGGAWLPPGILRMGSLTSLQELDVAFPAGLKTLAFPSDLNLGGLELRSRDISSMPPIGNVNDTLTFGNIISMQSLPTLTIGNITTAGRLAVDSNTVMTTLTLGNVTATAQVDFLANPALSALTTGAIKSQILIVQGNSSLRSLNGISSSSVVEDFEFVLDNGFSEDDALAFANRITVTQGVCQLTANLRQTVKCYQGPPWHR
jgi:hypothetical protein